MFEENEAIQILKSKVEDFPEMLMVLGSGWKKVLDGVEREAEIGYGELFGQESSVPGHEGKLVVGKIGGKRVGFMSGRIHMYEGLSAKEATLPIRLFAEVGMKELVLTAACGALNEEYRVGDFVVLNDLLTLFLSHDNPLSGSEFIDMSRVFDDEMRQKAIEICKKEEIKFQEGVYAFYKGPSFETPADKRALMKLGADVVGMSTVHEAIQARALGVKILGLAFVTNLAFVKHDHKEVLEEAEKGSGQMQKLLLGLV